MTFEREDFRPNGYHKDSLVTILLDFMAQNERLSLLGMAAAADVVAADCRVNAWLAAGKLTIQPDGKSPNQPDEEMPWPRRKDADIDMWSDYLDRDEANATKCKAALQAFLAGGPHADLYRELADVAAFLDLRNVPDYGG